MILKKDLYILTFTFFCSVVSVTLLYVISEAYHNSSHPFRRNINPHVINKYDDYTLDYFGYYFAGFHKDKIYLGNAAMPLYLTEIDTLLHKTTKLKILLDDYTLPFRYVESRVQYPYFFIFDGSVPTVFRGRFDDLKATKVMEGNIFFSDALALSPDRLAIRGLKPSTDEHILGLIDMGTPVKVHYFDALLEKQMDGIFDTDGEMAYDPYTGLFIYSHFYRNQLIVTDSSLQLIRRMHTIDTVTTAQLKIETDTKTGSTKMAAPPQFVNRRITAANGLLFVDSHLRASNDKARDVRKASSIDIYNLKNGNYISSFYLPQAGKFTLREFAATPTALYTIAGNVLQKHELSKKLKKESKKYRPVAGERSKT